MAAGDDQRGGDGFEPKILIFACNWCSYAGADLAGVSRLQMPPNSRVIRVMCSARVRPEFVITALSQGLDGVLVLGCHPGECHYSEGNYLTRRRSLFLKNLLEYVGIEPQRFQVRWVSASEGAKFADIVEEMTVQIKALGPNRPVACSDEPTRERDYGGQTARHSQEPAC